MDNELKPYEEYKKSQLLWVDILPSHWEVKRAKNMFAKANRPVREIDDVVTCFRDGVVTLRKNRRTTGFTESIKEIGYQGVRKGDLVIHVMDAFAGAIGVSDSDGKGTPVYSVCVSKTDLNNEYYAHIVREMAKMGYIQSLYRGIRERSSDFRFEVFANQYLPIPPRYEQDQIVKYLDFQLARINKIIKVKKKLITALKEQKQAVINEVVTKGLNPNVKMKPSRVDWLGDIPENWEIKRIKTLAKVKRGASPRPIDDPKYFNVLGDYAWVRISDTTNSIKYLKSTEQMLSDIGAGLSVKIYPGELIISICASVGKPCVAAIKCCIHDGFIALKGLENELVDYIYSIFSCELPYQGLGNVGTQLNLNSSIVGNIYIPIPPKDELSQINLYIEKVDNLFELTLNKAKEELELITEYRIRLISDVVTGKVDVRNVLIKDIIIENFDLESEILEDEKVMNCEGDE